MDDFRLIRRFIRSFHGVFGVSESIYRNIWPKFPLFQYFFIFSSLFSVFFSIHGIDQSPDDFLPLFIQSLLDFDKRDSSFLFEHILAKTVLIPSGVCEMFLSELVQAMGPVRPVPVTD